MPYFFILPLYLLGVGILLGATAVCFCSSRLRPWSVYPFAAAIGSVPGFVLANAALFFGALGVAKLALLSTWEVPQIFATVAAAATIFIGPFVASAIGVLFGASLGVIVAWHLKRRKHA